jgi:hypothetical protein
MTRYALRDEDLAANVSLDNLTMTDAQSWPEYAAANNITSALALRIGELIAGLTNLTIAHVDQDVPVPAGLGMFRAYLSIWQNYIKTRYTARNTTSVPQNNTSNTTTTVPIISETGWSWLTNLFTLNWFAPLQLEGEFPNYENASLTRLRTANLANYMTQAVYSQIAARTTGAYATNHSLGGLTVTMSALNSESTTSTWNGGLVVNSARRGVGGFGGRSELCDPRDEGCINCALVTDSMNLFIEIVLDCVEDLTNSKRFNFDITEIDLSRDNTFLQPDDKLACADAPPLQAHWSVAWLLDIMQGIGSWFGEFDLYASLGRAKCHLSNDDYTDPHSPLFYGHKLITCDPVTDGPSHRGRAGAGLWTAVLWVSLAFGVLALLGVFVLPINPLVIFFTVQVWLLMVLFVAYWWSPMCILPMPPIPVPVIPDALPSDLYMVIHDSVPEDCRSYGNIFDPNDGNSSLCNNEGRVFPDCTDSWHGLDLNFDPLGTRHMAYLLQSISPALVTFIRETSFPAVAWIVQLPLYDVAFTGIEDIHGTDVGEYCFGVAPLSLWRLWPLIVGILQFFLLFGMVVLLLLPVILLAVVAFMSAGVIVSALSVLFAAIARKDINWDRFYIPPRALPAVQPPPSATAGTPVMGSGARPRYAANRQSLARRGRGR